MKFKKIKVRYLTFIRDSIIPIIGIISFIIGCSFFFGLTYKSLRFAANYKETRSKIIKCTSQFDQGDFETSSTFMYDMEIEGFEYHIIKYSPVKFKPSLKFWDPDLEPIYDWCKYEEKTIRVFFFDKVKVATTFWDQSKNPNLINLALAVESKGIVFGLIILFFVIMGSVSAGGVYLVNSVRDILKDIKIPNGQKNKLLYLITCFNQIILPAASLLLAVLLIIFVGLAVIKGMLFIESSNIILTGIVFTAGIFTICAGPGLIIKGVYILKSTKNAIIVFIRNILITGALFKLVSNITVFFKKDFEIFSDTSVQKYLLEVIKGLF